MEDFRSFLEHSRKSNGEKLLPSTINVYIDNIERYYDDIVPKDYDVLIRKMNLILKNNNSPNLKASFKWWLYYLGMEKDDSRIKTLRKLDKKASALNSERILSKQVIPQDDMDLLIDSLDGDLKLAVMIFRDTGIRRSELMSINRKSVRLVIDGNIYGVVRVVGKGDKIREVYLRKDTVDLFKELGKHTLDPDQKIIEFYLSDGTPHKRQDKRLYDLIVKQSMEVLGYKINLHRFRHTTLSNLLNKTGNLAGVSKLAGHANFSTTQIYTKYANAVSKNMMRDLE